MRRKTNNWVCDCKDGFIYPMKYRKCLKCGAIPPNHGIDEEMTKSFIALFGEGFTLRHIAMVYSVAPSAVWYNIKKHNSKLI